MKKEKKEEMLQAAAGQDSSFLCGIRIMKKGRLPYKPSESV